MGESERGQKKNKIRKDKPLKKIHHHRQMREGGSREKKKKKGAGRPQKRCPVKVHPPKS